MKTMILAAAAVLSFGIGSAYAGDSEDGGMIPNTYFSELPGEIATAPGQPPNAQAASEFSTPTATTNRTAPSTTSAVPPSVHGS